MAPDKKVRLKYGPIIKILTVVKENGKLKVTATVEKDNN